MKRVDFPHLVTVPKNMTRLVSAISHHTARLPDECISVKHQVHGTFHGIIL